VNPTEVAVALVDEQKGWQARQITGLAPSREKTRSSWPVVMRIRSPVTSSAETVEAPAQMRRRSAAAAS
jgi:hypothetical protein